MQAMSHCTSFPTNYLKHNIKEQPEFIILCGLWSQESASVINMSVEAAVVWRLWQGLRTLIQEGCLMQLLVGGLVVSVWTFPLSLFLQGE